MLTFRPGHERPALPQAALWLPRRVRADQGRHRDAHDPGGQGRPPPNSAGELDYIRTNKNKVTYGNAGLGGPSHLCGMLLMSMLDTPMTLVPYKGTGPALTDLLGGHIDLICDQATNTISHIKSGKLKAYAVASQSRVAALPDLPTLDEAGLKGFETTVWLGMYAPKDTPKAVVDKVVTALPALQDPKVVERLADLVEPLPSTGRLLRGCRRRRMQRSPSGNRSSRKQASTLTDRMRQMSSRPTGLGRPPPFTFSPTQGDTRPQRVVRRP